MVWKVERKAFKTQLSYIAVEASLCASSSSNRRAAEQLRETIKNSWVFLKNLEELNDFYNNDEIIESVLKAAVVYFDTRHRVTFAKKDPQAPTDLNHCEESLRASYLLFATQSQQLVAKMESPDENMYAIHGQSKIPCHALSTGVGVGAILAGVACILAAALVAWPLGVGVLAFGIVSVVLGALLTYYSARNLHQFEKVGSGVHLEEITAFVDSQNPEPLKEDLRLIFAEQPKSGAPSYS